MEMNCEKIRELLPLYAGEEGEANERIAVAAHLPLCSDCTGELEAYRRSRARLSELRDGVLPPTVGADIWRAVRNEFFPPRRASFLWDWPIRYAAILVFGLAVGYLVTVASRSGTPAPETSPLEAMDRTTDDGRDKLVSEVSGSRGDAEFADSRREGNGGRSFVFELPETFLGLPRTSGLSGPYYLPQVEKILDTDERDF